MLSKKKSSFYVGDSEADTEEEEEDADELSETLTNLEDPDEDDKENSRFYPTLYDCLSPRVILGHVDQKRMRREARIEVTGLRKEKRFYDGENSKHSTSDIFG